MALKVLKKVKFVSANYKYAPAPFFFEHNEHLERKE